MAHFAKYTAAAYGHLSKHYERSKDADGLYIKFGNKDIDPDRTENNYNLATDREGGQIEYLHRRLSEIKVQKRADINVMCSWVVTLPKGDFTPEQERDFFTETFRFLKGKYGENNILSAYVHLDEAQPHVHFAFIPAVPDHKWNEKHPEAPREKLSAKECVTKTHLAAFHKELKTRLDERIGFDLFPVLNGATEGGNRTIQELKYAEMASIYENEVLCLQEEIDLWQEKAFDMAVEVKQAEEHLSAARYSLSEARQELSAVQSELPSLVASKNALRGENEQLQGEHSALTERIGERKEELELVERVIIGKMSDGAQRYGSMTSMKERIAAAKIEADKHNRLNLIEKFIALPQIKPLFEQFLNHIMQDRGKSKNFPER